MTVALGKGIDWTPPEPEPEPSPPGPSAEERAADLFAQAVSDLRESIALLPAPVVSVEQVDLAEIATAIQGIKGHATAEEIAEAVARVIAPPQPGRESEIVAALNDLAEKFEWRMQGMSPAFGASGPSNISDNPDRQVGHVTVDNFPASTEITNDSGNPVPVSGTVTATGPVTNVELRASAVPVSLADSTVTVGYTIPQLVRKAVENKQWIAGKRQTSSLGGAVAFVLRNPSGSGVSACIHRMVFASSQAVALRVYDTDEQGIAPFDALDLRIGAGGASESGAIPKNLTQGVSPATRKVFFYYGQAALVNSAGAAATPWEAELFLPANQHVDVPLEGIYALGADKGIGFEATLAAGASLYCRLHYYEQA